MAHKHKKRFGQHFLHNQQVIERIVRSIHPQADDHLVEIGPGEAAITLPLARSGATIDVIEIDRDLIPKLSQLFAPFNNITLHAADALTFDYSRLEPKPLRVVGNLPYNISSPLIFHLLNYKADIRDMHFMLQKEVVARMTAQPGSKAYGRLSVMVQYHCQATYLFTVGPGNFTPPPKVDSAIVRLVPRPFPIQATDEACLAELVKQAFSQRRKTLRNTLKNWLDQADFNALHIDPGLRAEALSVDEFVRLANHVHKKGGCP
ncbi:MAG TPA: 16S rRNA (adenine(1518)-N(6)/adenine(1519)-N(6))-dimethyltransferase RsmA [Sulfurivirga caldicuralii]|nr:16S rRNA (adenine(1518)-N(6)/adenine(1519)-N(6))-dimethyltransferase RsmA [Sulfurivirga caldicuralii]